MFAPPICRQVSVPTSTSPPTNGELVKRYPMHSTLTSPGLPNKVRYAAVELPSVKAKSTFTLDPKSQATLQIGLTILLIAAVVGLL